MLGWGGKRLSEAGLPRSREGGNGEALRQASEEVCLAPGDSQHLDNTLR